MRRVVPRFLSGSCSFLFGLNDKGAMGGNSGPPPVMASGPLCRDGCPSMMPGASQEK